MILQSRKGYVQFLFSLARPLPPIKTSCLAFPSFILTSYSVHTDHANFDFNQCSVFTECCF